MKRIKAMNGYTIYEVTARDEKQGNGTAGEFAVYLSSDVREYGVAFSTPEWDGVDSLEVAIELCGGESMTCYEAVKAVLDDMDTADLVALHNEYCEEAGYMDDYIYSMGEFDEIMAGREPWEVARGCFYGDFRPCDDWFYFNGYGNTCSFDHIPTGDYAEYNKTCVCVGDIADYIATNGEAFDNDEIQAILDRYEEVE